MRRHLHMRRGMTLIEVMLAVAILAVIVVLTWGSISTSFELRRASLEKFERYRTIQQSLDRMSREISMAFVTNIGQEATNDRGEITYRTAFIGTDDELTFTSLSHVRTRTDEVASEQCEVSYRLERQRGADGEYHRNLVRREDAPIDDDPEEGGIKYTLLEDVEQITFEYWDSTREIAGEAWVRQWDAINDHEGMLPSRVRITIEVPHPTLDNRTLEFVTQTQVLLVDPLIIVPPDVEADRQALIEEIQRQLDEEGYDDFSNIDPADLPDWGNDSDEAGQ